MLDGSAHYRRFEVAQLDDLNINANFLNNTRRQPLKGRSLEECELCLCCDQLSGGGGGGGGGGGLGGGGGGGQLGGGLPTAPVSTSQPFPSTSRKATDIPPAQTQGGITNTVVPSATPTESNKSTSATETGAASNGDTSASSGYITQGPLNSNSSSTPSQTQARVAPATVTESTTQLVIQTSVTTRDKINIPIIVGSVMGAVALLFILICATFAYFHRRARRRTASPRAAISPFVVPPPTKRCGSSNKFEAERGRIRTYYSTTGVDRDHQEEATSEVDEQEAGRQTCTAWESVIASDDVGTNTINSPPSYRP